MQRLEHVRNYLWGFSSTRRAFVSPVRGFIDQGHYRLPPKSACYNVSHQSLESSPRRRGEGSAAARAGWSYRRSAKRCMIFPQAKAFIPHATPPPPPKPTSATDVTANTPHSSRHSSRTATHSRSSPSPSTTPGSSATCSGGACCPSRRRRSSRSRSPTAGRCYSRP